DQLNVTVESVRGPGYRIPGGLLHLDHAIIQANNPAPVLKRVRELALFDETVSTSDWVQRNAADADWQGIVCLAERQTGGRGRRGRHWISPFGRNLYLSLGWEFEGGAALLEGLSLAVGVGVCRALGGAVPGLQLKWPNDILYQ